MTKGVLERETGDLERLGMGIGSLPRAVEARNEFYLSCLRNSNITGIGFEPEREFPFPRNSFPKRASTSVRSKEDGPIPWSVSIERIVVTSPNWDREDQKVRHWKGKNATGQSCYFIIEDEEFWIHAKKRDIRPDFLDQLNVQWAFQIVGGRVRNRRVLRVLEFNGERLAEPLDENAIRARLGDFSHSASNAQEDLFRGAPSQGEHSES